jgi:hypothetical protein
MSIGLNGPKFTLNKKRLFYFIFSCLVLFGLTFSRLHFVGSATPPSLTSNDKLVFEETFEDSSALENTLQAHPDQGHPKGEWKIKEGRLYAEKIHNGALWLKSITLSSDVRIEFDAWAHSDEGDLKCELFGDGLTHQSGYILIAGGWKNKMHVIARQDEHGEDRKEDRRCGRERGQVCIKKDQLIHWTVERRGAVLTWYMNDRLVLRYIDKHPLRGKHFAFNNWAAPVSFDNLKVYALNQRE